MPLRTMRLNFSSVLQICSSEIMVKILLEATDTLHTSEYNIRKISVMNCMVKHDAH